MDLDVQQNPVILSGLSWWSYLGLVLSTSLPPPVPLPKIETTEPAGKIYLTTKPVVNDSWDKVGGVPEIASSTQVSMQHKYCDSDGIWPPSILSVEQASCTSWSGYLWGRSAIAHDSSVACDHCRWENGSVYGPPMKLDLEVQNIPA